MVRLAVKLLLLDAEDQLLLIHSKDPRTDAECWYPSEAASSWVSRCRRRPLGRRTRKLA